MSKFTLVTINFLLHLIFISFCYSALATNSTDYAALQAFKSQLVFKPDNVLQTTWSSKAHFCNWFGVTCLNQRVIALTLSDLALNGRISSAIANMTRLIVLDLSNNSLTGSLPSELGSLHQLRVLNVTQNSLQGNVPTNLSMCQKLEVLDLSFNFMAGDVPLELGVLSDLKVLGLDHNNLTGKVPASLGNFTKLESFYLHENNFVGEVPLEIGRLISLKVIALRGNNFSGSVPASLFNISALEIVDLSINRFSGQLPESLGDHVPNISRLFLDSNRITGTIPVSLSNASKLSDLFLTENDLRGSIPSEFERLLDLEWFEFEYNQLSGNIPYGLLNISSLQVLRTRHNYLSGHLPPDLGNWLPDLQEIFLSHNQFSGEIPSSICNATKLVYLEVSNNSFSGPLPMMLGKICGLEHLNLQYNLFINTPGSTHLDFMNSLVNSRNLQFLILDSNPLNGVIPELVGNLSNNLKVFTAISCGIRGSIPYGLGNLSRLHFLGLSSNKLEGGIPSSVGGLQNLERLYLTGNRLKGQIPAELFHLKKLGILHLGENNLSGSIPLYLENLTQLTEISVAANSFHSNIPMNFWKLVNLEGLNLSRNHLFGSLPTEVGNLKAAIIIDLSSNNLSGEVPNSMGFLQSLLTLDMSTNNFQGTIPDTFGNLIVIEYLDMSSNVLFGNIPESLQTLHDLKYLNLSFNRLHGKIPREGVFINLTYQSFIGNPDLCGAPNLHYPLCPDKAPGHRTRKSLILKVTIPIVAITLLLVMCIVIRIILTRKKKKEGNIGSESPRLGHHRIITYQELVKATKNFNESNLLGSGTSSKVYKAVLSDSSIVAVKVFNMQYAAGLKGFESECEILSQVRHRNLVKIISTCSNMEFKAMVLEFMPNGSLHQWLHSESIDLSLVRRLDIIIDVALAMEYLHHDYMVPTVHCDLKPSNVLLDEDMTAHVADFGIAKMLAQNEQLIQTKTLGTIGYIAPEYGLDGQVSTKSDVYSFGILVLETFTRKRPTDDMFRGDLTLHQWVNRSFPGKVDEVLDENLLDKFRLAEQGNGEYMKDLVESIICVALLCSRESAEERIDMQVATAQLKKIRAQLKQKINK